MIYIQYVLQPLFESFHNGRLLPRRKELVLACLSLSLSQKGKNILKHCSYQGFMNLAKSLMVPSLFIMSYFTSLHPGTVDAMPLEVSSACEHAEGFPNL